MPRIETAMERYYAQVGYRVFDPLQIAGYDSVFYNDRRDKTGKSSRLPAPHSAWWKEAVVALRHDFNLHWLVKLEAHDIDGTSNLWGADREGKASEFKRRWRMFIARTTVAF